MITITETKGNIDIMTESVSYANKHASLATIALACFKTIKEDIEKDNLIDGDIADYMDDFAVLFLEELSDCGIIRPRESKNDKRIDRDTERA